MNLLDIFDRKKNISLKKYRIDWNKNSKSKFQFKVKQFFKQYWQYDNCVEEFPVLGTKMHCDIINFDKMIAIEVDGNFHNEFSEFYHKTRMRFLHSKKRDQKKEEWFAKNNIFLIRINEKDLKFLNMEWIKNTFNIDILAKYCSNN